MPTPNGDAVLIPEEADAPDSRPNATEALRWTFVRDALAAASHRFTEVLRAVPNTDARAIGGWTVGDTAAHVRVVALINSLVATGAPPPAGFEDIAESASRATMSMVSSEINRRSLEWEQRRDPRLLADVIESELDHLLETTRGSKGAETVHWLGGLPIPRTAVFAHMLSELLVHGHDIATAGRIEYEIPSSDALLYFECFLADVVRNAPSVGFLDGGLSDVGDVRWQLRLRGGQPLQFEYLDGALSIGVSAPPDVRMSADPAAMLLVLYNRISPAAPLLRGRMFIWGRRPWRLQRVTKVLRAP